MGSQMPNNSRKNTSGRFAEKAYLTGVSVGSADRGGVGNQNVFEQKRADGNDAGKRVQAAQNEIDVPWPARRGATPGGISLRCACCYGSIRTGADATKRSL